MTLPKYLYTGNKGFGCAEIKSVMTFVSEFYRLVYMCETIRKEVGELIAQGKMIDKKNLLW